MMNKDIRWKQRFHNLQNAFLFLQNGLEKDSLDPLQEAGVIQSFEFTFELAWKTLKDFLESQGITAMFPREVIKEAFQANIIKDGKLWLEMLDSINELSECHIQEKATTAVNKIRSYYLPGLKQMYSFLKSH